MGMREFFFGERKADTRNPEVKSVGSVEPYTGNSLEHFFYSRDAGVPILDYDPDSVSIESLYRCQPNLRKVVDFIARNVAGIPFHVYERQSDSNRPRVRDGALAGVLSSPSPGVSSYRFWHGIVSDFLLYDRWAALVVFPASGGVQLVRIPASRLEVTTNGLGQVDRVFVSAGGERREVSREDVILDCGYDPGLGAGYSPVRTLGAILAEYQEAVKWRRQVWANGPRIGGWIERPVSEFDDGWDAKARQRFTEEFHANYSSDGPAAGKVPLLEDGMKFHESKAFTPQDAADIDGRRLTAIEVAGAYHIAPELVGAQQGTYSNVREFRQMLYRDSLGPYISGIEGVLNTQLLPMLENRAGLYVEANLESKLRGSFEEQAQILQSSVGAPYLTRNEARAKLNMPSVTDGDELVTPLNVLIGGQASPTDSGSQNIDFSAPPKSTTPAVKSYTYAVKADTEQDDLSPYQRAITKFLERQSKSVLSAVGAKAAKSTPVEESWDAERWNRELADEILPFTRSAARKSAKDAKKGLPEAAEYDLAALDGWLETVAENEAERFNDATLDALTAAEGSGDGWKEAMTGVFATAVSARAGVLAATTETEAVSFAAEDVLRFGEREENVTVTKTWVVNSGNPRSEHAAMDGETVPLDDTFSNGARYPGDAVLPAEERANCACSVDYEVTRSNSDD